MDDTRDWIVRDVALPPYVWELIDDYAERHECATTGEALVALLGRFGDDTHTFDRLRAAALLIAVRRWERLHDPPE